MNKDNNNKNDIGKKKRQTKEENLKDKEKIKDKNKKDKNEKEKTKEHKLESITMYELKSKLPKDGNLTMYRKEEFEEENDPEFLEIINEILYGEDDSDDSDDYEDYNYIFDEEEEEDMDEEYDIFDRLIAEEEEERKEFKPKLRKICKKGVEEYTAKGERGAEFLELYEKLKKNIKNIDEKYELFMELEKMGNPEFALSVVLQYIGYSKKQMLNFDFLTDIYEYLTGTGGF